MYERAFGGIARRSLKQPSGSYFTALFESRALLKLRKGDFIHVKADGLITADFISGSINLVKLASSPEIWPL